MRGVKMVAVVVAAFAVPAFVPLAGATDGHAVVRIMTTGDAYVFALAWACPEWGPGASATGQVACLAKDFTGYDGVTGAVLLVEEHRLHPFTCAVVASATGAAFNGNPSPVDMVGADSIRVGFESHTGEGTSYGGRFQRPPIGVVSNRVQDGLANMDAAQVVGTPSWYMENAHVTGPTPVVSGTVDTYGLVVWNEGGTDVTVECTF